VIDLHLHILPGVDDGAASAQDALQMAAALLEAGVHTAVATPHFNDRTYDLLPNSESVARRVHDLSSLFAQQEKGLALMPGAECYLTSELPDRVKAHLAPTLGGGRYLLVELPLAPAIRYADRIVSDLHRQGVTVLLAHAERYPFVQQSLNNLEPLLSCGIGVQVSWRSLRLDAPAGQRRTAESLIERGIAHVLATDAHRVAHIQDMVSLRLRVGELAGPDNLALLTEENPRRVLAGERLLPCAPVDRSTGRSPSRRWWLFGRWLGRPVLAPRAAAAWRSADRWYDNNRNRDET